MPAKEHSRRKRVGVDTLWLSGVWMTLRNGVPALPYRTSTVKYSELGPVAQPMLQVP
jgi:hypothetical protein